MIEQLRTDSDPLYSDYAEALAAADTMLYYARACGYYTLLGGGDTNLYGLIVERALSMVDPDGVVALLTPSGIYGDRYAAKFFSSMAGSKRVLALYDFENRRGVDEDGRERGRFFPEVHPQFKFCTMMTGGSQRTTNELPAGFLLHDPPGDTEPERLITLEPTDFALVNPKTGTAPIFPHQAGCRHHAGHLPQSPGL